MAKPPTTLALPKYFSTWATTKHPSGTGRSRHDYDCPDHLLEEMLHDDYFAGVMTNIELGDFVWVTDAAMSLTQLRIDTVDRKSRKVSVSIVEKLNVRPIVDRTGYAVRWRGPRGGYWAITDADGKVIKADMRTKEEAERERDNLLKDKAA